MPARILTSTAVVLGGVDEFEGGAVAVAVVESHVADYGDGVYRLEALGLHGRAARAYGGGGGFGAGSIWIDNEIIHI